MVVDLDEKEIKLLIGILRTIPLQGNLEQMSETIATMTTLLAKLEISKEV